MNTKFNLWPPNTDANITENAKFAPIEENTLTLINKDAHLLFNKYKETCEIINCPNKDCIEEEFTINIRNENKRHFNDSRCQLVISIPAESEISYHYSLKLQFVEFVVYIGSTISLWFGLSIVGLYHYFLSASRKAKQKFIPT